MTYTDRALHCFFMIYNLVYRRFISIIVLSSLEEINVNSVNSAIRNLGIQVSECSLISKLQIQLERLGVT